MNKTNPYTLFLILILLILSLDSESEPKLKSITKLFEEIAITFNDLNDSSAFLKAKLGDTQKNLFNSLQSFQSLNKL